MKISESDYVRLLNAGQISALQSLIGNITYGDEYGIPKEEYHQVIKIINQWAMAILEDVETYEEAGLDQF